MNIYNFCASLLLLALPLGLFAQAPSTDGLVAYWKFDETTGTVANDTASTNDATLNSGTSFAVNQGQSGGALKVNATTGVASVSSFQLGGSGITISAWIFANSSTSGISRRIIGKENSTMNTGLSFALNVTSQEQVEMKYNLNGSSGNASTGVKAITEGQWHHIAVTYNGSRLKIYVDGVILADSPNTGELLNHENMSLGIGNRPPLVANDHPFNSLIDELRVYNRGLSESEVASLTTTDAYRQLPVTFTSFQATSVHSGVALDWTVVDQRDNAGFAVERAAHEGAAFTEIGFVPAKAAGQYRFTDVAAPVGSLYYRLRQVDYDGTISYSSLVTVQSQPSEALSVFPNPVSEALTIRGSGEYAILDAYGRQIRRGTLAFKQQIEVADLPNGTYTLQLGPEMVRFVKF